jgi:hypothetical protein
MIPAPLIPYIALGLLLLFGGTSWFAYSKGGEAAENRILAEQAKQATLEERVRVTLAEEISRLKVEHQTIKQKTEVITREIPVYRDCQHDDRTFGLLNLGLTPPEKRAGPAADSELPGTDAPR